MSMGLAAIRPSERRSVMAAFAVLFLLLSAHALVETARDALFLQTLSVESLPWVYLGGAALGALVAGVPFERAGRRGLVAWFWLSGLVVLGLWAWAAGQGPEARVALYLWSGLSISVSLVQVWQLISQRFSLDAAKRVFGMVGVGSVLGAIAGSLAGGAVASVLPVRHLLVMAAVFYGMAGISVFGLGRGEASGEGRGADGRGADGRGADGRGAGRGGAGLLHDLRAVLGHPYAGRLVLLGALASTTFTLVDFLFKDQVAAHVLPEDLGTWFAGFYAATNMVALAVQLLATGVTIRVLGVRQAAGILPVLLLIGGAGLASGLGLLAAVVLKGADGALKHTMHRTTLEVLYVPVPEALRARLRRVGDLLGLRVAQGLGSLGILGVLALGGGGRAIGGLVVGLSLAWLALAVALREHYLALFRGLLRRTGPMGVGVVPTLDLAALEALLGALNSDDDLEVLAALDLLDQYGRTHIIPSLILYHPSPKVVVRALDLFSRAGRDDHLTKTLRLVASPDPAIRAAIVRAQPDHSFALRAMQDPHPMVRSTALAALLSDSGPQAQSVRPVIDNVVSGGTPEEREALARALSGQAHGPFQVGILSKIAEAATTGERTAAASAIASNPVPAHLPTALGLLGTREARTDARRALIAMGALAVEPLALALADEGLSEGVRIHVPLVLAELPSTETAGILARQLLAGGSGVVRYRVLRALNRLHGNAPDVRLPRKDLESAVRGVVRSGFILLDWDILLAEGAEAEPTRRTPGHELLVTLVADKQANVRERLFRLLDLLHRGEDMEDIWRGLLSERAGRRASSLELLENVLPGVIRDAVVGLVDPGRGDLSRRERLAPGAALMTPVEDDYGAVLRAMLTAGSDSVQAIAAWHAGELGLVTLLPALAAIDLGRHPATREVVEHAIEKLERAG
jgi:ATP:ADP antiporter, AAA family